MTSLLNIEILTQTFDDLPVGIGIFKVEDLDDLKSIHYVYMNKVVLFEMRKTRDEVFGNRIIDVAPEAYAHEIGLQVIKTYRNVAISGESVNLGVVEYSNEMVAGKYECSVHPITDNYVYVMLRNVTELEKTKNQLAAINKSLEEIVLERTEALEKSRLALKETNRDLETRVEERTKLLAQKNEELSQFAYLVSHDLKEPLVTIASFIKLLEKKYASDMDADGQKYIHLISQATERMGNVIESVLNHSQIGAGEALEEVDIHQLIKEVRQDLQNQISKTKTTFTIGSLPKIKGYKTELRMLFQNLISNAIKFSKPNTSPNIIIKAELKEDWIFSVQDNGIGIPQKNQNQVFNIFERLHDHKNYEGTGIGLAHCKKIVELHQGQICLDSTEGEGSTFYFTIPTNL